MQNIIVYIYIYIYIYKREREGAEPAVPWCVLAGGVSGLWACVFLLVAVVSGGSPYKGAEGGATAGSSSSSSPRCSVVVAVT